MASIDFRKELKDLYQPSTKEAVQVDVPEMNYLMVDGKGDPNTSPEYAAALNVLFSVAYGIKFAVKKGPLAIDYGVLPSEGLWWAEDMSQFMMDKSNWLWTMMIMQPPFVTAEMVERAAAEAKKKKDLPLLPRLRFEALHEGLCAQIMHVGPFTTEGPTVAKVHEFIQARGELRGKHHEIYLSDVRKADPAKWKTIIRQPFTPR